MLVGLLLSFLGTGLKAAETAVASKKMMEFSKAMQRSMYTKLFRFHESPLMSYLESRKELLKEAPVFNLFLVMHMSRYAWFFSLTAGDALRKLESEKDTSNSHIFLFQLKNQEAQFRKWVEDSNPTFLCYYKDQAETDRDAHEVVDFRKLSSMYSLEEKDHAMLTDFVKEISKW